MKIIFNKLISQNKLLVLVLSFILSGIIISCSGDSKKAALNNAEEISELPVNIDLEEIIDSGVLRVITTYSPTGYFLYRGEIMGFEYEIFTHINNLLIHSIIIHFYGKKC